MCMKKLMNELLPDSLKVGVSSIEIQSRSCEFRLRVECFMENRTIELTALKGAEQMGGGSVAACVAGEEKSMGPSIECAWGLMIRLVWPGHRIHE